MMGRSRKWETSSKNRGGGGGGGAIITITLLLFLTHSPTITLAAPDQDPLQCLLALTGVEGCFNAVHRAALDRSFKELGQPCCQAVTGLADYCWPIIFPCRPLLPMLLKTICKFVPPQNQITHHHA